MNVLLLITGRGVPASVVDDAHREFADPAGVQIDVITWLPPAESLEAVTGACVVVGPPPARAPASLSATRSATPHGPSAPAQVAQPIRSRVAAVRRRLGRLRRRLARMVRLLVVGGVSRQFWRRTRRDDSARAAASRADVIVAVDTGAIRAAWHLARRHPDAVVTLGVVTAARAWDRQRSLR